MLYDCCLERLRQIFMEIHKSWKNNEHDVVNMEKGTFECASENQRKMFETGNIGEWDISLICNVLLFTKLSKKELKSNPSYEKAVRKILNVKNEFYSHRKSRELTKEEFEKAQKDLKDASLSLGVSEDHFDRALKGNAKRIPIVICVFYKKKKPIFLNQKMKLLSCFDWHFYSRKLNNQCLLWKYTSFEIVY